MGARKPLPTHLSIEQAAEVTEQSVRTIRRRVSDGWLPAYKFGPCHVRIRLEDLGAMAQRIASARPCSELNERCVRRTAYLRAPMTARPALVPSADRAPRTGHPHAAHADDEPSLPVVVQPPADRSQP